MIKCCLEWIVSRIIHFLRLFRYERCLWRLLFKIKSRINSLLALDRNFKRFDPISTIRSKCLLKKYSPRIWYSESSISFHRHSIHSWLQEKSLEISCFFRHTLYTNKGTNPITCYRLLRVRPGVPRKMEKRKKQGRLRPLDPSPGLMIGFATISTSFFFLSLSLFPPLLFSLFFFFYIYIHIHRYHALQCVLCVTGSFHFLSSGWPCIHCTLIWSKESSTRDWIPLWSTCSS